MSIKYNIVKSMYKVNNVVNVLEQPSLAIIIDPWEKPGPNKTIDYPLNHPKHCTISNVMEFVGKNKYIETIVLASYDSYTEYAESKALWYENYRDLFYNNQQLSKVKDAYKAFIAHDLVYGKEFMESRGKQYPGLDKTRTDVLNYVNPKKYQISMHWMWQLEYYLSLNPQIKNIYVIGQAWDCCVQLRQLGYLELGLNLKHLNILTNSNCTINVDCSDPLIDTNPSWDKITDCIYRYRV